jgi:nucleoside-diphosphate-sugar epimerase
LDELVANGSDLDRLLAREHFDQIVLTAQLTAQGVDWLIDRVDGRRWVVLSSAQLYSQIPAPGTEFALAREETALARGATVFRPTMIFGRGGDTNVSRMVRAQRRWRIAIQIGDGAQRVQPLHVADLIALVAQHHAQPVGGRFDVGGPEEIPTRELVEMVKNLLGSRLPVLHIPPACLRIASRFRLPGLRSDQVRRLEEDKTVDITATCATFNWTPEALAHRIEQAVWEVQATLGRVDRRR